MTHREAFDRIVKADFSEAVDQFQAWMHYGLSPIGLRSALLYLAQGDEAANKRILAVFDACYGCETVRESVN